MLSLNFSIGGVGAVLFGTQVAYASGVYTISGSVDLVGTLLNLDGTSGADPQTGANNGQHMAIDWDDDKDGNPETGTGWQVAPDGELTFSPVFFGGNENNAEGFNADWDASHDYSSFGGGTYVIRVMVYHGNTPGEDGDAQNTLTFTIDVPLPPDVNNDPVLDLIGEQSGDEFSALTFDANATDADSGDVLTYAISDAPAGSTFNTSTGEFSWTPGESDNGTYSVMVTVDDDDGGTDSETFDIVVNEVNSAPVISLVGVSVIDLILGLDIYSEPGATADDEEDGSGFEVTDIEGWVDSFTIGIYEVFYNFIDSGDLSADTVVRTVNVNPGSTECSDGEDNDGDWATDLEDEGCTSFADDSENQPPVISIEGDNPLEIVVNVGLYVEQGATANDAEDGLGLTVPESGINTSAVNTGAVSSYLVSYDFTDEDGASAATAFRTVNVVAGGNECNDTIDNDGDGNVDGGDSGCDGFDDTTENTPPEIVIETEMVMLTLHSAFNPPVSVHATDIEDDAQSLPIVINVLGNTVNIDTIGEYTVTYGATDSLGASAAPKTQEVRVRAECGDDRDNDDDGNTDAEDPACHSDGDEDNDDSYDPTRQDEANDPECNDGESNDNDEEIDFGEDEGCENLGDDSENIPPVIETELVAMTLTAGDSFVLTPGEDYSASDNEDGGLTDKVEVSGADFDTNVLGDHEVTLNVTDSDEAAADQVTITVTVEEAPPPTPACTDGEDNDGDQLVDESDPGCENSEDDDETDPSPLPPTPACSDEADNDQDGLTDLNDPGCSSAEDNDETNTVTPPNGGGGGGSSSYDYWGCTNSSASNFNSLANRDDGSCQLPPGNNGGGGVDTPPAVVPAAITPPSGEVLGAATTAEEFPLPAGCTAYLNAYLKKGRKNKADEVKLLQTFLNEEMGAKLPITGFFGNLTHASVKKFQVKYKKDILQPWIDAGYGGMDFDKNGTGYVYKTTKRAINMMKCAQLEEPMPELVPDPGN